MPVLLLLILAVDSRLAAGFIAWRYPRVASAPAASPAGAARSVGEAVGRHGRLRAIRAARLDPAAATGLALTAALVVVIAGGLLLGVLAYLVRSNGHLIGVDNGVAKWGNQHASAALDARPECDHPAREHLRDHRVLRRARCGRDDPGAQRLGHPVHRRRRWAVRSCSPRPSSTSPTGCVRRSTLPRRRSARRSRAATRRPRPRSTRWRLCCSDDGAAAPRGRSSPAWPSGSPSRSRRAASCSTCTGSLT